MDVIFIRNLRLATTIGVHQWERGIRQTVVISLEMAFDNRRASASDRVEDTLDYATISDDLRQFVEQSEYQLVESLAEAIGERLMSKFALPWLRLTLEKLGAVRDASSVGVTIERGERPV